MIFAILKIELQMVKDGVSEYHIWSNVLINNITC